MSQRSNFLSMFGTTISSLISLALPACSALGLLRSLLLR
jgi:hypothetical protein